MRLIGPIVIFGLAVATSSIHATGKTATSTIAVRITIPERVALEAKLENGERVHVVTRQYEGEVVSLVPGLSAQEFLVRPE